MYTPRGDVLMTQGSTTHNIAIANARALFARGDFRGAEQTIASIGASGRTDPQLLFELGRAQVQLNNFAEARKNLTLARKLAPGAWQAAIELSKCLQAMDRFEQALAHCDDALRLRPGHPEALARKAEILRVLGRRDEAYSLLEPLVSTGAAGLEKATANLVFARVCLATRRIDEGVAALEEALAIADLPRLLRSQLQYQLAALHNAGTDAERAWASLTEASELAEGPVQIEAFTQATDELIRRWTQDVIENLPVARQNDEKAVFIVGMPRSGSTLVEQILSRHSLVDVRGESPALSEEIAPLRSMHTASGMNLDDPELATQQILDRVSRKFLRRLREGAGKATRITDKTLLHYQSLGLISSLFPKCRILHCVRDPLDTCISCYFQAFGGSMHWTNNLYALGRRHRDYQRLMAHWIETLAHPIYDISYEDLVQKPERETRAIIDFLDLPWEDSCLDPAASDRVAQTASLDQVRQPVYTSSVGRAGKYRMHLEPLVAGLEGQADPGNAQA